MSSIYNWSVNSDSNQTSDKEIDWREGQAPSTVNNSARKMMARIAEFIHDTQYILDTTGDGKNYKLLIKTQIVKYEEFLNLNIRFNQNSKAEAKLSINNLVSLPILKRNDKNSFEPISADELEIGKIYNIRYFKKVKDEQDAFCIMSLGGTASSYIKAFVPTGAIIAFGGKIKEGEWLFCDGRELARKDYPELADILNNSWGVTTNVNHFKLPDLQGSFLRGVDFANRLDKQSLRNIGSFQEEDIKGHTHDFKTKENLAVQYESITESLRIPLTGSGIVKTIASKTINQLTGEKVVPGQEMGVHTHLGTTDKSTGFETRPSNHAVAYYIKT
ncbi:phage tail protein [Bartonella sp. DGB1]|uniref:phage tail protein n=1 Tax=Bartonella sp. DGB1 TaxID=3239807 RepID=UPI00352404A4